MKTIIFLFGLVFLSQITWIFAVGKSAGSPCKSNNDCQSTMCDPSTKICLEKKDPGLECNSPLECKSKLCWNNKCTDSNPTGKQCSSDGDCNNYKYACDEKANKCYKLYSAPTNSTCNENAQCKSNYCHPQKRQCQNSPK